MRIGIDSHAAEQDGSGNCTYIRGLLRALLALDRHNEYVLYAINKAHPFFASLERQGNLHIREIAVRNPVVRIPFGLGPATDIDGLDILHVQYIAPPFHRGKLVVTVHDLAFLHVPQSFSRFFTIRARFLIPRTARRAARIITGSEFCRRDIIATYGSPASNVAVVPHGIEPEFFEESAPKAVQAVLKKYGIKQPYILSVGRLNPRKNLAALVRAYHRLKIEKHIPHQLAIVGKTDYDTAHTIEEIRGVENEGIVMTGFVLQKELPLLYRGADIFVYASLFEGFGLPVLEAMAAGAPVITSNTTSLPETAGGAALLIDPFSEEDFATAMGRLAEDEKLREELRAKGRARAREFTWEAAARKTLAIYESVARDA